MMERFHFSRNIWSRWIDSVKTEKNGDVQKIAEKSC